VKYALSVDKSIKDKEMQKVKLVTTFKDDEEKGGFSGTFQDKSSLDKHLKRLKDMGEANFPKVDISMKHQLAAFKRNNKY